MYRPARGGRSCEHFGGYKTINRIPLYMYVSLHLSVCLSVYMYEYLHACLCMYLMGIRLITISLHKDEFTLHTNVLNHCLFQTTVWPLVKLKPYEVYI